MSAVKRILEVTAVIFVAALFGAAVVFAAGKFNDRAAGTDGAAWLEALATLGALVAATAAAIFAARVYVLEARRDEHRDQVERSAQASLVAAWGGVQLGQLVSPTAVSPGEPPAPETRGPTQPMRLHAWIRNASPLPVYDLWLQIYLRDPSNEEHIDLVAEHHVGLVDPGKGDVELDLVGAKQIGESWYPDETNDVFKTLVKEYASRGIEADGGKTYMLMGWSFQDVRGERWVNGPHLQLHAAWRPKVPSS